VLLFTDTDECTVNACANGASCQDNINGYSCVCVTGYTGTLCETSNSRNQL